MKNKFKYLLITVLVIALFATAGISAAAEEIDTDAAIETEAVEAAEESTEEYNFFTEVYEDLSYYASEILCALTLAGSLTLAVAYKKGLLPLLEGSLVSIGNAVTKMRENAKESAEKNSELTASIEHKLESATKVIDTLTERIEALGTAVEESLSADKDVRREKQQLRTVMAAQIDMLYDIFMSASLPQYQKDAVGERIAKMREALCQNADTE